MKRTAKEWHAIMKQVHDKLRGEMTFGNFVEPQLLATTFGERIRAEALTEAAAYLRKILPDYCDSAVEKGFEMAACALEELRDG